MTALPVGRAQLRREGRSGLAILVFGTLLESARKIADRLDATLVNMRFVKPLDEAMVIAVAGRHRAFVTIEKTRHGRAPAPRSAKHWRAAGIQIPLLQIGIPDKFIEHGSRDSCLAAAGLDLAGLNASVDRWWAGQTQERLRSVRSV